MFSPVHHFLERHPMTTGLLGTISTLSASAVGFFDGLEVFIRISTGAIGLLVGILTLLILWRKWRKGDDDAGVD